MSRYGLRGDAVYIALDNVDQSLLIAQEHLEMIAPLFKKNTLEQTGFAVDEEGFSYRGRTYSLAEIIETRSYRVIHQTRHIPLGVTTSHDPAFSFLLIMRDGEAIQVTEQSTLLSTSKQERVDQLQKAYDFISEKTFQQRANKYLNQIQSHGYFDYGAFRFSPIDKKIIEINSGKAKSISELEFLRSYGFIELVPKNESLAAKTLRRTKQEFSGKRYGISTLSDGDVFFALLAHYFRLQW